ncbi:MAG: hypothetical protein COC03_05750 [Robiginitomaculum sp.]|nr:MAG: hypothetical protein COC03_05750 [Robiginitomaculum sp.]
MRLNFISFLSTAAVMVFLVAIPVAASATNPQSCYDGYVYLNADEYKKSISKLSACLRSKSVTVESRAIAYYNRAVAYFFLFDEELYKNDNYKKADKYLFKALEDVEKSIELDPVGTPKAYCLRGWIYLEESWGMYGYEDLDKGIAMGAPKDFCDDR